MKLSIVFPVFNEEHSLSHLFNNIQSFIDQLADVSAEVIFVDDHSTDASPYILSEFCKDKSNFKYLRLAKNSGSHIAIMAGMRYSTGDCAVFLASDLQDPIELVNDMLVKWREGYHIIWAVREDIQGIKRKELFLGRLFYRLINLTSSISLPPNGADFALLDRKAVKALVATAGSTPSLGGNIAALGFRAYEIPYIKQARKFGKSKWNFSKRIKAAIDAFVSFSFAPMRLMSYAGILCAIAGFLYALVVIILRILSVQPVTGWSSLMVVVLLIGGIQMIMLGVLGEYLWRNLEESRKKPLFFIEDQSDNLITEDSPRFVKEEAELN